MKLVYSFNINNDNSILELCQVSKCLYNQALYEIKENLKTNDKFLFYKDLDKIMKTKVNLENQVNYKLLKAQTSQQILKLLEKDILSYIRSIKDYSKNKDKYKGKPELPKFKKKHNLLVYTNQSSVIRNGYLYLNRELKISIPQYDKYKDLLSTFNQVRIIPKMNYLKVEIIYEKQIENSDLNYDEYSSIDLGIDNLVSLVTNNQKPLLFSGKQIKSLNQYFNKTLSRLQSIKDKQKIKGLTHKIRKLYENRENELKDLFHKISRFIVNYLLKNKIGNLVIGYNKGWKDSITLGKKTNQKFVQIPYQQLISYLQYKCDLVGIKIVLTEESYTSKCDSLSLENIGKQDNYSGKRIKRGLFQSSVNKLLNADINGSLNIMRKVVDDSYVNMIINSGLLFNPIKIRNLFNMNLNFL